METKKGWTLFLKDGLKAHFKQPNGPSRPGTDWAVKLSRGDEKHTIMVRAYADDVAGASPAEEVQLVLGYVARLLASGWSPASHRRLPGELVFKKAEKGSRSTSNG